MLEVKFTDPQSEMFRLRNKCAYPLFVGGYGSGKTHALQINAIWDCLNYDKVRVATYAPTYDLLNLNLIPRVEETLATMGLKYTLNKSQYSFDIEGGSQLICRSMDNPGRIIAYEVFRSHIDEIDTLPRMKAEEIFLKVTARNRQEVIVDGNVLENTVAFYTTPDHGFSSFTYNRWGKGQDEDFQYVRASTDSNPHTVKGYADKLRRAYTDEVAAAYVAGEWCNMTSGIVYYKFDRSINGCKTKHIHGENIHIGIDFNVGKMAVIVYVLRNGLEMHAVHEITDGKDTPDIIQSIKRRFPQCRVLMYPDASGSARKSNDASTSDIILLTKAGFVNLAGNSNPRVRDRVLAANKAFEDRRVFINVEACPIFTECLEQQPYDIRGEPDKSANMDHANDAGTYPIAIRLPIIRPISSGRVAGAQ